MPKDRTPANQLTNKTTKKTEAQNRRAQFAREMTRSVFGKYYWDDGKTREIQRSLTARKPGGKD